MTPADYVQEKAAPHGSSLHYAQLLVPAPIRPTVAAWLAWVREVRAIPREVHDPGVAGTKLAWWTRELQSALDGHPNHPALQALMPHAAAHGIDRDALVGVLEGTRIDLEQTRFLDWAGLERWLALTGALPAQVVARALTGGRDDPAVQAWSGRIGTATQLVRLLRDVGADARQGRLYLPVADLQQHDVKAHEVLRRESPWGYGERFTALMCFEADRAEALFDEAARTLPEPDRRALRPLLAWGALHRALLRELRAGGFQVLHQRVALTPLRKLWIATRTQWTGR